jgi:hypothetical protein
MTLFLQPTSAPYHFLNAHANDVVFLTPGTSSSIRFGFSNDKSRQCGMSLTSNSVEMSVPLLMSNATGSTQVFHSGAKVGLGTNIPAIDDVRFDFGGNIAVSGHKLVSSNQILTFSHSNGGPAYAAYDFTDSNVTSMIMSNATGMVVLTTSNGNLGINSSNPTEQLTVGGNILVEGSVTLGTALTVSTDSNANEALHVSGDAEIAGNLHVTGDCTLDSGLVLGSNLEIGGYIHVGGDSLVLGSATFSSNVLAYSLDVTSNVVIGGTLLVEGNVMFDSNLDVAESTSNHGNVWVGSNLVVDGSILGNGASTFLDGVTLDGGNLFLQNNSWIGIGVTPPEYPLHIEDTAQDPYSSDLYSSKASAIMLASEFRVESDVRIKKDIEYSEPAKAIDLLTKLRPCTYSYRDPSKTARRRYGFIAQDVEEVIPEMVDAVMGTVSDPVGPAVVSEAVLKSDGKGWIATLSFSADEHQAPLEDGDMIRIKAPNGKNTWVKLEAELHNEDAHTKRIVVAYDDETIPMPSSGDVVTLLGRRVPDFKVLATDQMISLLVGGMQDLIEVVKSIRSTPQ